MASKKFSPALAVVACILALVIGFLEGFAVYTYIKRPTGGDEVPSFENDNKDPSAGEGNEEPGSGEGNEEPGSGEGNEEPGSGEGNEEPGSGEGNEEPGSGEGNEEPSIVSGDLQIHFLELGNGKTGDCVYIKAGETDILIDAGSRTNSVETIDSYLQEQMDGDRTLEYVIATHAHQDHIACFAGDGSNDSLFELYECETIIDFPQTEATTQVYKRYVTQRDAEVEAGAEHYTALECYNETGGAQRVYELSDGISMEILYQEFYEEYPGDENNCSVCVLISQGDNYFLLTGDLEAEGEESLVKCNPDLPKVKLFKAGHHGSYTASSDALLDVIQPEIVCVCCCAGNVEYLSNATDAEDLLHSFPAQEAIDRISKWTDRVYVTTLGTIEFDESKGKYVDTGFLSMNGNIVVSSSKNGIEVACSNNNTLLKDTEWFKENRTTPSAWLS